MAMSKRRTKRGQVALKARRTVLPPAPPTKPQKPRLPWPRKAEDGVTSLGVDIVAKRQDILCLVHKYVSTQGKPPRMPLEDLHQEIFAAIIKKNYSKSAHDPRKSSFGHYVWLVSHNVCCNVVAKSRAQCRIPWNLVLSFKDLDQAELDLI